jgi:hypothetical protein
MAKQKWTDKDTVYFLIAISAVFAIPWILSNGYLTPSRLIFRLLNLD